jgi:hypothetical protein
MAWRAVVCSARRPGRLLIVALTLALLIAVGCQPGARRAPGAAPPPNYTGPAFLRGTVGSMCYLRDAKPLLVSKYGLVVNLDGTGSAQVPVELRQRLINEMRKRKVGSRESLDPMMRAMSPEQMLARRDTAVVAVQGLIPPGAQPGTRFDVLVSKWPRTDTTTLTGGTLWSTELNELGTNLSVGYMETLAVARGPIYINPFQDLTPEQRRQEFAEQAIVVGGGRVTKARPLELVLNQPSYQRCRAIAERINDRFGLVTDARPIAEPKTESLIKLNIPPRYARRPGDLLTLISHTYVQSGIGYEQAQAQRLGDIVRSQPEFATQVTHAWKALGRAALPSIRPYYVDDDIVTRMAALEAGAFLEDERSSESLLALASHEDPAIRIRVAKALVSLPRSLKGGRALRQLLDDDNVEVRITAYESLEQNQAPIIERTAVFDIEGQIKFAIDRVPASKPLIFVTHQDLPRIVIFDDQLGFKAPLLATLWDNHLMLEGGAADKPISVYYQGPNEPRGQRFDNVYPSVATLAYLLGHRPTLEAPQEGLDLSYSEVVDAMYKLCQAGHISAPIEFKVSPLQRLINEYERLEPGQARPETTAGSDGEEGEQPAEERAAAAVSSRPETTEPIP